MGGRGSSSSTVKKGNFNDFRFGDLNYSKVSNKYITMDRINTKGDKVVVRMADEQVISTKYGYGLILDREHIAFLKDWQVSKNYYGTEVLLNKKYFNPKKWGTWENYTKNESNLSWNNWVKTAKAQKDTKVHWQTNANNKRLFFKS